MINNSKYYDAVHQKVRNKDIGQPEQLHNVKMATLKELGQQYIDTYSNRIVQTNKKLLERLYYEQCSKEREVKFRRFTANYVQKQC